MKLHFATNHLGPPALTGLLLDSAARGARRLRGLNSEHRPSPDQVWISTIRISAAGLTRTDWMPTARTEQAAVLQFCFELDRRSAPRGTDDPLRRRASPDTARPFSDIGNFSPAPEHAPVRTEAGPRRTASTVVQGRVGTSPRRLLRPRRLHELGGYPEARRQSRWKP